VPNTTADGHIRHVNRHSNLLDDRTLMLDHHDLRLRWRRLRRRFLDHRCFDRPLASAADDRLDHFLAEPSLLQLGERRRIDGENATVHFDQCEEHLIAKPRSLEIDEILQRYRLSGRHAERDDDRSGSDEASKHEQIPCAAELNPDPKRVVQPRCLERDSDYFTPDGDICPEDGPGAPAGWKTDHCRGSCGEDRLSSSGVPGRVVLPQDRLFMADNPGYTPCSSRGRSGAIEQ
jgi:hypothetical protein